MERFWISSGVFLLAIFLLITFKTSQAQSSPERAELITSPESAYYVSRKKAADIMCEATGITKIVFYCKGTKIPESSQTTFESYDDASGKTVFRSSIKVTRADVLSNMKKGGDDDYWCLCEAMNEDTGDVQMSGRSPVQLAYLKKRFVREPASQTVQEGDRVVFTCVPPKGKPTPEIIWRKSGRRLSADRGNNLVFGDDGSLTITAVRTEDAGNYECVAKNDAARRLSNQATLTVEDRVTTEPTTVPTTMRTTVPPMETDSPTSEGDMGGPKFLEVPQENVYITPDQNVSIVCDVKGADLLTVRCNGLRVDDTKLISTADRAMKHIRSVLELTYEQVENYINTYTEESYKCGCIAWYTDPTSTSRQWMKKPSEKGSIYLAYLSSDFEEQPSSITAQLGTDAVIYCAPPEGKPNPYVHWMFENRRLDPRSDARYRVDVDGSLVIQQVQASDQGTYFCVAANVAGRRRSRDSYLTVSDEPVVGPRVSPTEIPRTPTPEYKPTFPATIPDDPVFTEDLEMAYYLNEAGEASLMCTVVASDKLTFRCNNARLSESRQVIKVQPSPNANTRLLSASTVVTYDDIANSQLDDYSCQCVAWYLKGKKWHELVGQIAVIKLPYLDASFVKEPRGRIYSIGDTAQFECQPPLGEPVPEVTWSKNRYVVDPRVDNNFEILDDATLVLKSVRPEDAGEYVCIATNSAGARSSIPATLELESVATTVTTTTTTTAAEPSSSTSSSFSPTTQLYTTTPYYPGEGETTEIMAGKMQPIFTIMPDTEVYIRRGTSAELNCQAMEATFLAFYCNGVKVEDEPGAEDYKTKDPTTGFTFVDKMIEVTVETLESYTGSEPYTCQCRAYFNKGGQRDYIASDNSTIRVAFLAREFKVSPVSQTVEWGIGTELMCQPPRGVPKPQVYWLKDGFPLKDMNQKHVTPEGNLIFDKIDVTDAAEYTCVAQNVIGSRYSDTVSLTILEKAMTTTPEVTTEETSTPEPEEEPEPEGETEEGEEIGNEVEEKEGQGMQPRFLIQPESVYRTSQSQPAVVECMAKGVDHIAFVCNSVTIADSRVEYQNEALQSSENILRASIEVSQEEVENYESDFSCYCVAHITSPTDDNQYLTSTSGMIKPHMSEETEVTIPAETTTRMDVDSSEEEGAEKEMTGSAESTTGMDIDSAEDNGMDCKDILQGCSVYMPQAQRDQAGTCENIQLYVGCLDKFLQQCESSVNEVSFSAVQEAKNSAQRLCSGGGVCPPLKSCHMQYTQQLMADPDSESIPMVQLCIGIDTFLTCADKALMACNMTSNDPYTSLSEVAKFFREYCDRVADGQWGEQCDKLEECDLSTQQATELENMLQTSLWCPQVYETMACTRQAVDNCPMQVDVKDDLNFLDNLADATCPSPYGPEVTGETGEDDDGGDEVQEPDASKDDRENGATNCHASVLLTSLLSLLFAITVCR